MKMRKKPVSFGKDYPSRNKDSSFKWSPGASWSLSAPQSILATTLLSAIRGGIYNHNGILESIFVLLP